jgi:LPXTG-site transpeptidase (sortase) family protein
MLQKIKDNRDWILIILGGILIIVAALNLVNFNPYSIIENVYITPAVDQAGFAPVFIPKEVSQKEEIQQQTISPNIPERLIIDKIKLDAPVELAKSMSVTIDGEEVTQFLVPEEFAAGWDEGSAPLGVPGNTVLSGHHNAFGEVFKRLVDLEVGDTFTVLSGAKQFNYIIANKMILPEKNEPLSVRLENSRWIMPSTDERVTLVTCWPATSNTHRLIIVAVPLSDQGQSGNAAPTPAPTQPIRLTTPVVKLLSSKTATPMAFRLSTSVVSKLTSSTPTPTPQKLNFIVRNSSRFSVNIRETPDIKGKIIESFKAGDEANGIGRISDGSWIFIDYDGTKGWVSSDLVEILMPVGSLPTLVAPIQVPQ